MGSSSRFKIIGSCCIVFLGLGLVSSERQMMRYSSTSGGGSGNTNNYGPSSSQYYAAPTPGLQAQEQKGSNNDYTQQAQAQQAPHLQYSIKKQQQTYYQDQPLISNNQQQYSNNNNNQYKMVYQDQPSISSYATTTNNQEQYKNNNKGKQNNDYQSQGYIASPTTSNKSKGHSDSYEEIKTQSYAVPDFQLTSRPVTYTPPHVTFHPPQIIVSESGIIFTNPETTYSHELPSDGQQVVSYQQVFGDSSSTSVAYPQISGAGGSTTANQYASYQQAPSYQQAAVVESYVPHTASYSSYQVQPASSQIQEIYSPRSFPIKDGSIIQGSDSSENARFGKMKPLLASLSTNRRSGLVDELRKKKYFKKRLPTHFKNDDVTN